jgi:hypothetical protein
VQRIAAKFESRLLTRGINSKFWPLKANSHTCHAAPLPFSDSAVSFVKVRVVAGRSRTREGRPLAVSGRPMLIHTSHAHAHAALCRGLEKSLSEQHGCDKARARHGLRETNTAALCK